MARDSSDSWWRRRDGQGLKNRRAPRAASGRGPEWDVTLTYVVSIITHIAFEPKSRFLRRMTAAAIAGAGPTSSPRAQGADDPWITPTNASYIDHLCGGQHEGLRRV
jgi:hypothetical protein